MGPIEALRLALGKEKEARALYERLANEIPSAREVFIFLTNEEEKHQKLIERRIAELSGA